MASYAENVSIWGRHHGLHKVKGHHIDCFINDGVVEGWGIAEAFNVPQYDNAGQQNLITISFLLSNKLYNNSLIVFT